MTDYLPRNFTSGADEAYQYKRYMDLLNLQTRLQAQAETSLNEFADTYAGKSTAPVQTEEDFNIKLEDEFKQKDLAITNARTVMRMDFAKEFVNNYLNDLDEYVLFNQSFPNFKENYLSGFTMITPTLMNKRWELFKDDLETGETPTPTPTSSTTTSTQTGPRVRVTPLREQGTSQRYEPVWEPFAELLRSNFSLPIPASAYQQFISIWGSPEVESYRVSLDSPTPLRALGMFLENNGYRGRVSQGALRNGNVRLATAYNLVKDD
jgi:hypothetical protein